MNDEWVDISLPLKTDMMHWPGDPPVRIEPRQTIQNGADCNVSGMELGSHSGTHMDAPLHFIESGRSIDRMPASATLGPAKVILIEDKTVITASELGQHGLEPGDRILFKTRNSERLANVHAFFEDYVHLSEEAARLLAASRIQTVGIDSLSIGSFLKESSRNTHRILLEAGIWILEGLDLSGIQSGGLYELACLPLRIEGGDGAPARAFLKKIKS